MPQGRADADPNHRKTKQAALASLGGSTRIGRTTATKTSARTTIKPCIKLLFVIIILRLGLWRNLLSSLQDRQRNVRRRNLWRKNLLRGNLWGSRSRVLVGVGPVDENDTNVIYATGGMKEYLVLSKHSSLFSVLRIVLRIALRHSTH